MAPRLTACIVVKDRRDLMAACLASLEAQEGVELCEGLDVVIVDNGSTDGNLEACAAWAATATEEDGPVAEARVVSDPGSLGAIRDRAVAEATTPYVAFVDSDCTAAPGWAAALVRALDADPTLGVVQGRTIPDPSGQRSPWDATQDIDALTRRFECCNIAYRAAALEGASRTSGRGEGRHDDAGVFGSGIGAFGEDSVAGWEVRRAGWSEGFAADAVVAHVVGHPPFRWHLRRGLRYGSWPGLVARFPELRSRLLHGRVALRPRSARLTLAAAGVLAATALRRPVLLVLALPYLRIVGPRRPTAAAVAEACRQVSFDAAVAAGLARGSAKHRTVVL